MPSDRMQKALAGQLAALDREGRRKGAETVTTAVLPAEGDRGPRILIDGEGDRSFLRMNSNGYLGMALRSEVIAAEEEAVQKFGVGPQAVRFISGSFASHVELERRLSAFHAREAAMIFSSAYATVMGILPSLITNETAVISDELNHNCIINAIRLAGPTAKYVYPHLDLAGLESALESAAGTCQRALVVTDGIFSMRGDHAPLHEIEDLARRFDEHFPQNVVVVVDDSHGVGAFGETGRGTEEFCAASADILVATLGKALGVNGGYLVGSAVLVEYLREVAPFYVYSNPITPGEAASASKALELLDGPCGRGLLAHLREMTLRFERGIMALGYETIPSPHPVVPCLVRDSSRTAALVEYLRAQSILATGLAYPIVPRGDEEVRFQISADHTRADIDEALAALASFER
ncbi:MAG: aminotransferase class I/II-fold pyridoxal phosphate-dependent enzyme [Deltaproteobacteria bacterium]|nr:aminotransferase class I/II-fold pyridoxal phosphate-dependent enzyme [Deltaproteobacteria bacterium]